MSEILTADSGENNGDQEQPCHWLYDLEVRNPDGSIISSYFLQADSPDQIPKGATHVRPTYVGDPLWDIHSLESGPPEMAVHAHSGDSRFGRVFTNDPKFTSHAIILAHPVDIIR